MRSLDFRLAHFLALALKFNGGHNFEPLNHAKFESREHTMRTRSIALSIGIRLEQKIPYKRLSYL